MDQELDSVTVKMPAKMKAALEELADREFTSSSGLIKKAVEKLLLEHGIDWREGAKKGSKKGQQG
jgi:Arc/MetJ-type ribon-helix-helix transcriptional regulator